MELTDRLKSFAKDQLIMLISLVLIFGALSVLSVFFFASERKNSLLFVEFRAEESAFALLDFYAQGLTPGPEELEQIVGFAIYNKEGSAVVSAGRFPRRLNTGEVAEQGSSITINWKERTVSIAKPLGMFPAFMAPPGGIARMRGMMRQSPNTAIYV
ncbi:MAG: hypothetical protein HN368_10775, partial [Spirochaetales bacterium]|nr:hypothetical protein [Spirochaetales bacterium]